MLPLDIHNFTYPNSEGRCPLKRVCEPRNVHLVSVSSKTPVCGGMSVTSQVRRSWCQRTVRPSESSEDWWPWNPLAEARLQCLEFCFIDLKSFTTGRNLRISPERCKSDQQCGAEPPQTEGKGLDNFLCPLPVPGLGPSCWFLSAQATKTTPPQVHCLYYNVSLEFLGPSFFSQSCLTRMVERGLCHRDLNTMRIDNNIVLSLNVMWYCYTSNHITVY